MDNAKTFRNAGERDSKQLFSSRDAFAKMCQLVESYRQYIDFTNVRKAADVIKILVLAGGCPGAYPEYLGVINHFLRYLRSKRIALQSVCVDDIRGFWEHKCTTTCYPSYAVRGRPKFIAVSRFILFLQYQGVMLTTSCDTNDAQICIKFRDTIERLGVGTERANTQARQSLHFLIWLRLHCISPGAINNQVLDDFSVHDCRCGLHMRSGRTDGRAKAQRRIAVQRFLRFLANQNPVFLDDVFIRDKKPLKLTPSALRYQAWLVDHRGLQPRTVYWYVIDLMRWLPQLGEDASAYSAEGLRTLAMSVFGHSSPAMQSRFIKSIKSYVRFRAFEGHCSLSLMDALISRPSYRLSTVPRRLDITTVNRVIDSCDLNTSRGVRERAILILLAQLGLRAVEVWRLRLEDFEWSQARLRIKGKGGRGAFVPLTQDAGDAVLDYLDRARPLSDSNALFLRSRRPYTSLGRAGEISSIACFALARCGHKGGAHVFRHSLATELLRDGRSLEDIATVLRHRSVSSTMIYAKVDEPMLRRLAEPWMGEQL
ncbi:tyrosine-type recombinase/integrase [Sphingomonas sp. NFX23]|uniref:tyrosine-type recombinase/integrase n=1 Tax=Sphingomonas sp. NFX23 TaxID=2819532 RepID=UPI003CF9ED1F